MNSLARLSTVVVLVVMGLIGSSAKPAFAQIVSTCNPSIDDTPDVDRGGAAIDRDVLVPGGCSNVRGGIGSLFLTPDLIPTDGGFAVYIGTNTAGPGVIVSLGSLLTNVQINGSPAGNVTTLPAATGTPFAATVRFELNGSVYQFMLNKPGSSDTLDAFTVLIVGSTESSTLDSQQDGLTPLIMRQTAQSQIDGVSQNVGGRFSGGGVMTVSATSSYAQSSGVQEWFARRSREIDEEKRAIISASNNANTRIEPAAYNPVAAVDQMFNIWIRGELNYYDGDGSSFDGLLADIIGGADYKLTDSFLVGVLGGYNSANLDTQTAGGSGEFEADGFSVGPYIGVQLSEFLILDALFAYTRSDYDNRVGATIGDFDADRYTFAANLTGKFERGVFFIEPSVSFTYAVEKQESYVDSAALAHGSNTVRAGRVTVGPKLGYVLHTPDGTVTPWVAGYFVYDFSNQGNVPASGLPDLGDLASASIGAGIDAALDGFTLGLRSNITGLGSGGYVSYGGSAQLGIPF